MTATVSAFSILLIAFRAFLGVGLFLVTFLMGVLVQSFGITILDKNEKSIANVFIMGFLFVVALSQILIVPPTLYGIDVTTATPIWWGVFLLLSLGTVKKCKKDIIEIFVNFPLKIHNFFVEKKCGGIYGILATLFVVLQLVGSILLYHYDDDDAIYVTTVASNVAENNFFHYYGPTGEHTSLWSMAEYITNGWYDLVTIVCQSTKVPAAIIMHTILPILMVALAYAVVMVLAKLLIKKDSQRYLFILFVSVINILNNVSTHTSSSVLLMRMHQGKALFANIVVPVMFCVFLLMWNQQFEKKYVWLLLILNTSACAFSTSGLFFGAMLTFVYAVVVAINYKNIKKGLYTCLAIVPNIIFAIIYVAERMFEVW